MSADQSGTRQGRWRPTALQVVWIGMLAPALTAGISTSVGPQVALFVLLAGWLSVFDGRATWRGLILGSTVAALLLCHTVITESMGTCRDLMLKSVASQFLLILVLASLCVLAGAGRSVPSQRGIARLVAVLLAAVVVHKIYLVATGARETIRPSGFFSEPSHLALALAPLLIYLILDENPRWRRAGILGAVLSLWLAASATLFLLLAIGLVVMWLALHGRRLGLFKILQVTVLSVVFAGVAFVSPFWGDFVDRVTSLGNQSAEANVSSVVYVMGWELALENLTNSGGWGLGFNRMGCEPRPVTEGVDVLDLMGLEDGNYNDGSFLASKALSEMGYFAALLWLWCAWRAWRFRHLLHGPQGLQTEQARLMLTLLLCGLVGVLLRGTGYFSGPVLLAVYGYFWLREAGRQAACATPVPTMPAPSRDLSPRG